MTVYFMQAKESGLIKIGYIRRDAHLRQRRTLVQYDVGEQIDVIALMPGELKEERELHRQFADERESGEWFRQSDRLLRLCAENDARSYLEERGMKMLMPVKTKKRLPVFSFRIGPDTLHRLSLVAEQLRRTRPDVAETAIIHALDEIEGEAERLTVRLSSETRDKLRKLAAVHEMSEAEMARRLIEDEFRR